MESITCITPLDAVISAYVISTPFTVISSEKNKKNGNYIDKNLLNEYLLFLYLGSNRA